MVHILGQNNKQQQKDPLGDVLRNLSLSIEHVIASQGVSDPEGVDRWADSIAGGIATRLQELSDAKDNSVGKSLAGITQFLGEYCIGAAEAAGNLVVDQNGLPIVTATEEQKMMMASLYAKATCFAILGVATKIIDSEFRGRAMALQTAKAAT